MALMDIDGHLSRRKQEKGKEPGSKISPDYAWVRTLNGLTQNGTAEPLSRD